MTCRDRGSFDIAVKLHLIFNLIPSPTNLQAKTKNEEESIGVRIWRGRDDPIWRAEAWSLEKVSEPIMERRHRHPNNPKSPKRKVISKQEMEEQKLKTVVEDEDERLELVK
ncbi:hypothetical protein L3X38_028507 [Prunus dulcis]|uniref:Uncharacterized protein n=1 Tax=Prunus dulcis TaxID=3755 RepID=A0AAD4Z1C0_PRUDU|nr:hypothetical protein L3X38_028507 [Prunus dulcis]